MKRFIRTAMTVMLAVMAVACSNDEEQPIPESRGTVRVSINGIINGYTPQDATRAIAQNVVRIMWQGGETVYVYEGTKYLGSLTATKGDDAGTYATLSGDINSLTPGKTLTLVYSPQFSGKPTVSEDGKLSLDLSTQDGKEVPFLIYATMPATEAPEISGASVHFDLATSIYKCNCTGLVAEGDITQAVIGEVNTVCELTLSDEGTPTVSGTTSGNITRTAGFAAADQRAIFSVAVAKTDAATARTIDIIKKGGKKFSSAFDKAALAKAAAYNTVLAMVNTTGFVDLGVKTATGKPLYWAECNLGASNPEDPGNYYMWGATALMYSAVDYTKKAEAFTFVTENPYGDNYKNTWNASKGFAWDNAPFTDGVYNNSNNKNVFTKYTTIDTYAKSGTPDNMTTLEDKDDAATAKNASWRMPTIDDFKSLVANCVLVRTTDYNDSGKAGYIVYKAKNGDSGMAYYSNKWHIWNSNQSKYEDYTGQVSTYEPSDNHIFLPAAGIGFGANLNNYSIGGVYWSSSLATSDDLAFALTVMSGGIGISGGQRQYGYTIRPVTE